MTDLDAIDLRILAVVAHRGATYKAAIADTGLVDVAASTVGRHVESLRENGYLARTVFANENTPEGLTTTAKGRAALADVELCQECGAVRQTDADTAHTFVAATDLEEGMV